MRPELVGYPNEFRSTLVAPGRILPHLEEGRNAGAHPQRIRMRGSGKTEDFKPATFREFRNLAENPMRSQSCSGLLFTARCQPVFLLTVVAMNALQACTPNKRP